MTFENGGNNPSFDSVETGELLNSAIGDGVDYSDPRWFARSKSFRYTSYFYSIDGYGKTTDGSATISNTTNSLNFLTGTTSGSTAAILEFLDVPFANPTWDKDRTFVGGVRFPDFGGEKYITTGRTRDSNGVNKTREHIGIAVSGGDLIGTVGDGSTETTTTLASGPLDVVRWQIEHTAGSEVVFNINGAEEGRISSNLPTGASQAKSVLEAWVSNSTSNGREMNLTEFTTVQVP